MFRRRLGWTLVVSSLLLHIFTVYCFARQPDRFAAYTVMPIWIWGGLGLFLSSVAFCFLRASLSLIMTAVWAVTLLVGADEARVLANLGKSAPLPGKAANHEGKKVLRIATLNCAFFTYGDRNPAKEIAAWQPDIVLLQDVSAPQVRQIADVLYGGAGDYRAHDTNGIITNGRIQLEIRNTTQRDHQVRIVTATGETVEVVNIHLRTAATDLRFWNRSAWHDHRANRILRENELTLTRNILERTTRFPNAPTILGGDFNAPASDVVHRQLTRDFIDAFSSAGTGWGDTFQRRFPILRIDHIYATRHFTPVRSRAVTIRSSDHRMVVADLLIN